MNLFPTLPCDPDVLLLALTVHVLRLVGTYLVFHVALYAVACMASIVKQRGLGMGELVITALEFLVALALLVTWATLNWASIRYLYHVLTLPT